jgi:hypothetical protein
MINNKQELDFSQAENYTCEECGHDHFVVSYIIKKFSALISPTGQEMITPISCFACAKCSHINKDFLPENETL